MLIQYTFSLVKSKCVRSIGVCNGEGKYEQAHGLNFALLIRNHTSGKRTAWLRFQKRSDGECEKNFIQTCQ